MSVLAIQSIEKYVDWIWSFFSVNIHKILENTIIYDSTIKDSGGGCWYKSQLIEQKNAE